MGCFSSRLLGGTSSHMCWWLAGGLRKQGFALDWGLPEATEFYAVIVQSLSCVRLRPHGLQHFLQVSLSITVSRSSLKPMSIESVMPSSHLILCRPLLLLSSVFPSTTVFSYESALCIRWPMYWSFSFSISPSNEYSGLISFWVDWFDLLAVWGTLKSLLQHHSLKASILWHSAFFIFQLSHPYMTTGKNIASTRWIFVGKVTSLLFISVSTLSLCLLYVSIYFAALHVGSSISSF